MDVNCVRRRLFATGDNGSNPEAHTFTVSSVRAAHQIRLHIINVRLVTHALWLAQCERFHSL